MQKVFLSTCALFLFVLMACSQETNPTTPGASLANDNPPVVSQAQGHDFSKQTRNRDSLNNKNLPAYAKAATPELPCSGTTIKFTTNGSGVSNSSGSGSSRQGAITSTIENAIIDDILGQFSCALCEETGPCEPFWDSSSIKTEGAFFEGDPGTDCTENLETGEWECHGDVDFGTGSGGTAPSAKAGCKTCPTVTPQRKQLDFQNLSERN